VVLARVQVVDVINFQVAASENERFCSAEPGGSLSSKEFQRGLICNDIFDDGPCLVIKVERLGADRPRKIGRAHV